MSEHLDWSGAAPEIAVRDEADAPLKDEQLATEAEGPIKELIDGVRIRPARTIPDHRGSLCVILDPRWGFDDEPLAYTYWMTVRPGAIKGWIHHTEQEDRMFMASGAVRWVLYDDREGSPTRGRVNELFFDEHNRSLMLIPRFVWHAVENVGTTDAVMINQPTQPYNYESPDKTRLPIDTDRIPFTF